tara:strand:+ start:456 stop:794 length:339 start_codon:yes stop_codon:yes gene_type:complete
MVEVPASSSSSGASPSTRQALDEWSTVGQPALMKLFSVLHRDQVIEDPTLRILMFSIVGAYTNYFSKEWVLTQDIHFAHASALSRVMSNPEVAGLATKFMGDMVAGKVEELI